MAKTKSRTPKDDPEQSRLFVKKAREIDADEQDSSASDKLLGRLAKMKPVPRKKSSR